MTSARRALVLAAFGAAAAACGGSPLKAGGGGAGMGGAGGRGAGGASGRDAAGSDVDASSVPDAGVLADVAAPADGAAAADASPDLGGPVRIEPRAIGGWHLVNPPPPGGLTELGRDLAGNITAVSGENIVRWTGSVWLHIARMPPTDGIRSWWVGGPDDVWGVGDGGQTVHWDGHEWWLIPCGVDRSLEGVSGSAPDDVWAVGAGVLAHWDGRAWTVTEAPYAFEGVWSGARDDVWAVGGPGVAFHFDGLKWSETRLGDMAGPRAVWGSGPNDVWAAGVRDIFHFDGRTWMLRASFPNTLVRDLWGLGPKGVWARDTLEGKLFRWDGVAWAELPRAEPLPLGTAWDGAPTEAWVSGVAGGQLYWSGRGWAKPTFEPVKTSFMGAWGSGANDVWAVGYDGGIAHWNGARWSSSPSGVSADLAGVWGSGQTDVWAVGAFFDRSGGNDSWSGVILHWDGATWKRTDTAKNEELRAVWGSGPTDVWVAGTEHRSLENFVSILRHWDGVAWSAPLYAGGTSGIGGLRALWGSAADDVWAVGSTSFHWDGKTWSPAMVIGGSAWGSGPNDVWTVLHGGASHWNGVTWSNAEWLRSIYVDAERGFGTNHPDAVWGSGPNDVHAVGENGDIYHWDGQRWTYLVRLGGDWMAAWGSGPDDVWAFGNGGVIAHN